MVQRILGVLVLQLLLVTTGCSSDSGDNSPELGKGEVKADYIVNLSRVDDFVIDGNNNVFLTGITNNESIFYPFRKIDVDGKMTTLRSLDYSNLSPARFAISKNNEILLVARGSNNDSDKIFRFENNFLDLNPFYTMKPISSPFAAKIKLSSICSNNDNTYFVFDMSNRQIKRVVNELNTDVFVAGSEKNEIKDGTGLNAGFSNVTKIISNNNILYLIDDFYESETSFSSNIRKLEYINNEWKVTTLVSTKNLYNNFIDIAFDSKNDLYVLTKGVGISKLNLQDNTLTVFKDELLKIWKDNSHYSFETKSIELIRIKGDDLYIQNSSNLFKISDFQSKFSALTK